MYAVSSTVAVYNTSTFDPTTVNVSTLRFGPPDDVYDGGASVVNHEFLDADGDGDLDLVVYFETQETGFEVGDEPAVLLGETTDGTPLYGDDDVTVLDRGR